MVIVVVVDEASVNEASGRESGGAAANGVREQGAEQCREGVAGRSESEVAPKNVHRTVRHAEGKTGGRALPHARKRRKQGAKLTHTIQPRTALRGKKEIWILGSVGFGLAAYGKVHRYLGSLLADAHLRGMLFIYLIS